MPHGSRQIERETGCWRVGRRNPQAGQGELHDLLEDRGGDVGAPNTPPLAMAPYISAICKAVADMPCPKGMLAAVMSLHDDDLVSTPVLSPGREMPVGAPSPKARMDASTAGLPIFPATCTVP